MTVNSQVMRSQQPTQGETRTLQPDTPMRDHPFGIPGKTLITMQLGVFHQPQAKAHLIRSDPLAAGWSVYLALNKDLHSKCTKGKMEVCLHLPLASSDQHSLTQAQQWRREAALGKAGKLSRPSQRYLLFGICWRSNVTATNLRHSWMLQKKTDSIKRDSSFESANTNQKSWRGSCWTSFVIVSLSSLVFPCLHSPVSRAGATEQP